MNLNQGLRPAVITKYLTLMGAKNLNPAMNVYFHLWAEEAIYLDDMPFKRHYGIVEDLEGQVYKIPPEALKFIK